MQDNIITWNLANWVSVVLMALVGFMARGAIVATIKKKQSAAAPANQTNQ